MTELDDNAYRVIRSWVGDVVTEDRIDETYAALGNIDQTIIEILRWRISVMTLDEPGVIVVDGITINQSSNLKKLQEHLDGFIANGGSGLEDVFDPGLSGGNEVLQMSRPGQAR